MAGNNEAKIKFTAETTEFNQQIQKANENMSELRSETRLLEERFRETGDAVGALTEKKKILSQELQESENKVESLRQKLEKAKEIYGENSSEVTKLKTQLNNAERQYASIENEIDDVNKELKENDEKTKAAKEALDKLASSTNTSADGFTVFKGVLVELAKEGLRLVADGLKEVASYTLDVGMSFEAQMSKVQAISGATAEEMEALNQKAKQMGSTTAFTATEAGEAFEYMAMAGWKTGDMLNGIDGIMALAAASGEDLGKTSDIVTDALTAFGYTAKDSSHFADILAVASSNANTNVGMMGETFKYVASVSGGMQYSAEDVAFAIGLIANSGIKASQAGTSLRTIMTRLGTDAGASSKQLGALGVLTEKLGVEFYNADGSARDFKDIILESRVAWADLNQEEQINYANTIGGQRAMSAWMALMNASEEDINKMTDAIANCDGAAQDMADTMLNNLQGDLTLMQSALEGVGIQAYEGFRDPMREAVQSVTETLQSYDVARLINGIGVEIGGIAQKVATELPGILSGVIGLLSGIIEHFDTIKAAVSAFIITWTALKALNIAMGIASVVKTVATLVTGLISGTITLGGVTAALGGVQAALAGATMGISLLVTGVVALVSWLGNVKTSTEKYSEAAAKNASVLTEFKWGLDNLKPTLVSTSDLLSATGKSMNELDSDIEKTENSITEILKTALSEQRQLREDELLSIQQYNEQLAALNAEKLETYRQQQRVILMQIQAEGNEITQQGAAQMLVNAQEAMNQANAISEASYQQRLSDIYNFHQAQGTLESEAYYADVERARLAYEEELDGTRSYYTQALSLVTEGSAQWMATDGQKWATIVENANGSSKAYAKALNDMDMDTAKAFLQMYITAKAQGAEISEETEQTALNILRAFDDLPEGMDKAGKDTIKGLVSGMESYLPSLSDTTDKTANEIVDGITSDLGIASPSRVLATVGQNTLQGLINGMSSMSGRLDTTAKNTAATVYNGVNARTREFKQIGGNIAEGIGAGMEDKQSWLGKKVSSIASGLVSSFKNAFGIHSPSTVTAEMGAYLDEGLGKGIEDNTATAIAPFEGLARKIRGIDVSNEFRGVAADASLSYDVSAQFGDYVSAVIDSDPRITAFDRLVSAIEDLAGRAVEIYMNDRMIASTMANAADSVNGARYNLKGRGLAL